MTTEEEEEEACSCKLQEPSQPLGGAVLPQIYERYSELHICSNCLVQDVKPEKQKQKMQDGFL